MGVLVRGVSWRHVPSGKAARRAGVALNYSKTNLPPSLGIQMHRKKSLQGREAGLLKNVEGILFKE